MEASFLLPDLADPDSGPFWEGTARGEILVQTCAGCGRRRIPPRPMCFVCRSLDHMWERQSGRATVWSFVIAHPPLLPAYAALAPYNVIIVCLDEDPTLRMVGNLVSSPHGPINEVDPASIRIGEPVRAVFQRVDDVYLPRWMRVVAAA